MTPTYGTQRHASSNCEKHSWDKKYQRSIFFHQRQRTRPIVSPERVAAGDERGAGVEHLVLGVARAEFRADRVPGQFQEIDPLARCGAGRDLRLLDDRGQFRVGPIALGGRQHDQGAAGKAADRLDRAAGRVPASVPGRRTSGACRARNSRPRCGPWPPCPRPCPRPSPPAPPAAPAPRAPAACRRCRSFRPAAGPPRPGTSLFAIRRICAW